MNETIAPKINIAGTGISNVTLKETIAIFDQFLTTFRRIKFYSMDSSPYLVEGISRDKRNCQSTALRCFVIVIYLEQNKIKGFVRKA